MMKLNRMKNFIIAMGLLLCVGSLTAQDWANLKRYQPANEELAKSENKGDRVVFMGNSITEGWGKMHPAFFSENPYVCRGISGQTTPQMLVRFRQDVIALDPKAVVILAGTNDIAGNTGPSTLEMIMDNLSSMAEIAHENGIKVYLCSVLPAIEYPWKKGLEPAEKIVRLNQMIRDYCKQKKFTYVDYHSLLKNEENGMIAEYTNDGVHVTSEGYDLMEELILKAMKVKKR